MAQTKVQEYVPDGSNQNSGIQYVPEVSNQNSGVLARRLKAKFRNMSTEAQTKI